MNKEEERLGKHIFDCIFNQSEEQALLVPKSNANVKGDYKITEVHNIKDNPEKFRELAFGKVANNNAKTKNGEDNGN